VDSSLIDPEPPTDEEAATLRREFEAGNFFALHEAFLRFGAWGLPLPAWVFIGVSKALEGAWVRNAASKGQRAGGYRTRFRSFMLHFARHEVAARHLAKRGKKDGPKTADDAFDLARAELAADKEMRPYRGSAEAIGKSYYFIQGVLRPPAAPDEQDARAKAAQRPVSAR
jgi:hypothetical protein